MLDTPATPNNFLLEITGGVGHGEKQSKISTLDQNQRLLARGHHLLASALRHCDDHVPPGSQDRIHVSQHVLMVGDATIC